MPSKPWGSARTHDLIHDVTTDLTDQPELAHERKLEGSGPLAAGVAGERDRPIELVNDHVRFLQAAVEDVMRAVENTNARQAA
ncbi:hypothetical protein BH11MYX1_BH11MYX1_18120 [soil metagenome]